MVCVVKPYNPEDPGPIGTEEGAHVPVTVPPDAERRRGLDTSAGQAAFCHGCDRWNPEGPDICLGWLKGVFSACCGHGSTDDWFGPFVMFDHDRGSLRGQAALDFFATAERVDSDPNPRYCQSCGTQLRSVVWWDGKRVLCRRDCPGTSPSQESRP